MSILQFNSQTRQPKAEEMVKQMLEQIRYNAAGLGLMMMPFGETTGHSEDGKRKMGNN